VNGGIGDSRDAWYVLQTKPKQEARAEANLRMWGIETLSPRIRETSSSTGTIRVASLFPNYLFARFDAGVLSSKIRLTRGVQKLVGFGEYATAIDDSIIETIRGRIAPDGFVRLQDVQPGDAVEVVTGPLKSFVGVFERYASSRDRVVILLTAVASHRRVQLARMAVRRLVSATA
jgi:transcriptional antiterminator RfaH